MQSSDELASLLQAAHHSPEHAITAVGPGLTHAFFGGTPHKPTAKAPAKKKAAGAKDAPASAAAVLARAREWARGAPLPF